jgi:uncharacterized protein with GYD domain
MLVARQGQGFVVPPRPSSFAVKALYSTSGNEVASMRAGEIKTELESYGISTKSFLEKGELVDALVKARAEGLTPKKTTTPPASSPQSASTSSASSKSSSASSSSSTSSASREERLKEELEKCKAMKASDMKKELEEMGVSTKSFFEKSEFAQALAEAKVDGAGKRPSEGYAEYKNVEVLTDDSAGPRPKGGQQAQQQSSSPFGGASPFGGGGASPFGGGTPFGGGGASPFGDMGGMGGIADMLKNMGGMGGGGANPFGGGMGGMGDAVGKAQEMMKNPKVREIIQKAQSNPKMMAAVTECMSNPAAFTKYQNDPEIAGMINELRKYMM